MPLEEAVPKPKGTALIRISSQDDETRFMYSQHHIKAVSLATDSGSTSNMSISVMTSISEQDERGVSLEDDCPDYDAVVDRRQETFPWQLPISVLIFQSSLNGHYLNSHDDSRSSINSLPRALKGMSISSERHMSSGSSRQNPRPLPRHERYIYTYRLLANAAPLHFMISCAKYPFHPWFFSIYNLRIHPQRRTRKREAKAREIYFSSVL